MNFIKSPSTEQIRVLRFSSIERVRAPIFRVSIERLDARGFTNLNFCETNLFAILSYHCVLYYRKSTLSEKFELDPNNMGNYKSRPQSSCSEELRKKISEFHATILKKLDFDLRVPLPNDMR